MENESHCEICKSLSTSSPDWQADWPVAKRSCPRCGEFVFDSSVGWWDINSVNHMVPLPGWVRLSAWVRQQNSAGVIPAQITPEISRRVAQSPIPGLRERANSALLFITRRFRDLDRYTPIDTISTNSELAAVTYCARPNDVKECIHILVDDGYLRIREVPDKGGPRKEVGITTKGLLAADVLREPNTLRDSDPTNVQGFIAMSFDANLDDAWKNGLDAGIRRAGFRPLRIDQEHYVGGITDRIMTEIRNSRFIVADYTGHKHGVYFEAGFAEGNRYHRHSNMPTGSS